MAEALFLREGEFFMPTELAGGPWNPQHLHGGPPTGLLAHVLEVATGDPAMRLTRLTVDLLRPVPRAPLRVVTETIRRGRRLQLLAASIVAQDKEVCRASALFLAQEECTVPEFGRFEPQQLPPRDGLAISTIAELSGFPGKKHGLIGLHTTAEACRIDGMRGQGWGRAWMRLPVPVVADEPASLTVQAATLCDFGNGIGQLRLDERTGTINADITLYLHRPPRSEWIGLEARSRMETHGNGLVETRLYDQYGPIGVVTQSTLAMPQYIPRA
ncbi:MAG: thioesterase family protein [Xanthomonadaceae bacterium]|nr:thioesterase family protein [Xanthomonadaceae bacterium]